MSIKTLPSADGRPVITALILSIIAHAALVGLLVVLRPVNDSVMAALFGEPSEPLIIDVIELPPGPASPKPPAHPSFYSDRNNVVDKETWPEPGVEKGGVDVVAVGQPASAGASSQSQSQAQSQPATGAKGAPPQAGPSASAPDTVALASKGADDTAAQGGVGEGAGGGEAEPASQPSPSKPGLFPSDERLGELARRYEAEAPKGETGKVLNLNTSELRYQRYLVNMKNRIEYLWEYPVVAVRNGWQGKLNIEFTIRRDGTVSDVKLLKSSNYPVLDDGAMTVLRLAAPFAPFPDDFAVDEITIKGEFVYVITSALPPR